MQGLQRFAYLDSFSITYIFLISKFLQTLQRIVRTVFKGDICRKTTSMLPTREHFKEFMAFVQNAQEKEDKVNDAFELIWDEEQAQLVPFYISPWWKVVRYAFCLLFNLKFNKLGIDDVLEWWMEEAPKGEAKYWIDDKEYNVSDIDAFYDYLIELSKEPQP